MRVKGIAYISTPYFLWILKNRLAHLPSIVFPIEVSSVEDDKDNCGSSSSSSSTELLRPGDRILSVDGKDITGRSVRDVKNMLNNGSVGEIVVRNSCY